MSRIDGSDFTDGFICVFTNAGAANGGLSASPSIYHLPAGADRLAVGDLDNDGYTDLAVGDAVKGTLDVIKNVPGTGGHRTLDPSVSTPTKYYTGGLASVAVGDVDADGNRDILVLYGDDSTQDGASVTSSRLRLLHNDGTGNFTDYFPFTLQSQMPSYTGVVGNVAIGDLNVDGTTAEIVVADGLSEKVSVLTLNPYLLGLQKSFSTATATLTTLTAGAQVRAVDIGDLNKDFGMDIIAANSETTTPGDLFLNAKAGTDDGGDAIMDPIPDGNVVTFGSVNGTGLEGTDFTVNLLRGKDSTGQVLVYINFGGDAIQLLNGVKNADYSVSYPAPGSPVVFPDTTGPEAHLQVIRVHTIKNTIPEAAKTLYLSFGSPVGDAITGASNSVSVALIDGKPLVLAAPGALTVTPSSVV
jgi:hypothetical protein